MQTTVKYTRKVKGVENIIEVNFHENVVRQLSPTKTDFVMIDEATKGLLPEIGSPEQGKLMYERI